MAVVGKGFAVVQSGKLQMSGPLAWLAWAEIHLHFLAQSSLRVSVFVQWVWTYLTGQRGSRLIVNHRGSDPIKSKSESPSVLTGTRNQHPPRACEPLAKITNHTGIVWGESPVRGFFVLFNRARTSFIVN